MFPIILIPLVFLIATGALAERDHCCRFFERQVLIAQPHGG